MSERIVFCHLSDPHLLAEPGVPLFAADPDAAVRRVLAHIAALPVTPAFFIISGDLTNDGHPASYARLRALLAPLTAAGVPVLLALGNHDDRAAFRQVFAIEGMATDPTAPCHYSRRIGALRVLVLDSHVPGAVHGALGSDQLAWLDEQLRAPAPGGDLLVVHHPVTATGVPWLDQNLLHDASELAAVLAGRPPLGILTGHCHVGGAALFAGTLTATAPSITFQFHHYPRDAERFYPGSGFNLCAIEAGRLVVNPVIIG